MPKEKDPSELIAARRHNWSKAVLSGFKSQIAIMLEEDIRLSKEQLNDLRVVHDMTSRVLKHWKNGVTK
jgi:hypothetical protein